MKNYIVIGGSSGIGKEIVNLLSPQKANIWATYNNTVVESTSDNVHYQKLNVLTDTLDLDSLPQEIHGLVYCPGSINLKPFHRFTEEDFIADFRLQVSGATKIIQTLFCQG